MGVFKIKNKQLNLLKPKIAFLSWYEYSTWLFIITNDVVIYRYRYLYRDNADALKPCRRWICKKKILCKAIALALFKIMNGVRITPDWVFDTIMNLHGFLFSKYYIYLYIHVYITGQDHSSWAENITVVTTVTYCIFL